MWREFWGTYWKRLIGVAAGLFLSIIYLAFGFWDTLVVAFIISIGYWYGKQKEMSNGPVVPWQRLWHALLERFRPFR